MSTTTAPAKSTSVLKSDEDFMIRICDITTADNLAQQVLDLRQQAGEITSLYIDTTSYFDALEEAEDLAYITEKKLGITEYNKGTTLTDTGSRAAPNPVEIAASLCAPITTILTAITSHGGSLRSFTWPASSYAYCKFTRPPSFILALYAHVPTLEKLHLDFFCHEVHTFFPLPPDINLDKLKVLQIDASSAHGDDGSVIDDLLSRCKNLEVLHFEWPPCDLDSCQIKNISWRWTFTKLRDLSVFGWNFAPAVYTQFLVRHSGITSIEERIDGPYDDSGQGYADIKLPITVLPNLRELTKRYTNTHPLASYFDTAANRPISSLTLHATLFSGIEQSLLNITNSAPAQTMLRTLQLKGDIKWLRASEISASDSSDDSDSDSPPQARQQRKEDAEFAQKALAPTHPLAILKKVLPAFSTLHRLTLDLDSSNPTYDSSSGGEIYPAPLNSSDLLSILACLPSSSVASKLTVLQLQDKRALPLDDAVSEALRTGEIKAGGLRNVLWEGEGRWMYGTQVVEGVVMKGEGRLKEAGEVRE